MHTNVPAGTAERLCQAQVDQVELGHSSILVLFAAEADEDVFRLEISVYEARNVVERLQPGNF